MRKPLTVHVFPPHVPQLQQRFSVEHLQLPASPGDQTACDGIGTVTFTVAATDGLSYQWEENDNINGWISITDIGVYTNATTFNFNNYRPKFWNYWL